MISLLRKEYLMKQYEYKVEVMFPPTDASVLNSFGAEGWMLVTTYRESGLFFVVFMREKQ